MHNSFHLEAYQSCRHPTKNLASVQSKHQTSSILRKSVRSAPLSIFCAQQCNMLFTIILVLEGLRQSASWHFSLQAGGRLKSSNEAAGFNTNPICKAADRIQVALNSIGSVISALPLPTQVGCKRRTHSKRLNDYLLRPPRVDFPGHVQHLIQDEPSCVANWSVQASKVSYHIQMQSHQNRTGQALIALKSSELQNV